MSVNCNNGSGDVGIDDFETNEGETISKIVTK